MLDASPHLDRIQLFQLLQFHSFVVRVCRPIQYRQAAAEEVPLQTGRIHGQHLYALHDGVERLR